MFEGLLEGKSVVITGTGSGVGRAAAEVFGKAGARLICTDVNGEWLEETVALVSKAGGEAKALRCDVANKAEVDAAVGAAVQAYGRLDIMYNNAGIATPAGPAGVAKLDENTEADMDRLIGVNLRGVIYGCQAALKQFRAQGGGGVIVNTASVAGMMGWGGSLYASTKGAVVNLTRALAMEVAAEGIRVNSVCPGAMATHFGFGNRGWSDEAKERMAQAQPLKKLVDPVDVANAALFLASDLAPTITGVLLPVDSGMYAGR